MLVLLIDDDQDDQQFFESAISEIKYAIEFYTANDGIRGLTMLANPKFNPDFIFVDMNMPKMTGLECVAKIKEIERLKDVPVFMYSTTMDDHVTKSCFELGAAGVIKKPTNVSAISEKLREIFEGWTEEE